MSQPVTRYKSCPQRDRALLVFTCLLLAIACDSSEKETRPSPHPNVLLFVVDSLRADHRHGYGYAGQTSPAFDRLAREGARFESALAPTSLGLSSLVTLLTSLPPELHRVNRNDLGLSDEALTLPEVLREAGFATAAVVAGLGLEPDRGLAQGFDAYHHVSGPEIDRAAESWLTQWDRAGRVDPFFLLVHTPLSPREDERVAKSSEATDSKDLLSQEMSKAEGALARYDRAIRRADAQLDRILKKLDALEITNETLIVATSSHGEEFLERGHLGHGKSLHGESVRVPLLVRFPRLIDAGKIVVRPARLMDIGSTILMLSRTRLPAEFGFQHDSVGYAIRDLTEFLVGEWNGKESVIGADLPGISQSLRQGSYKLIRLSNGRSNGDGSDRDEIKDGDTFMFFNIEHDPEEQHDLSDSESRRAAVYLEKLRDWRNACVDPRRFARPYPDPES
jgi:arylsulfatase A-like enzyme